MRIPFLHQGWCAAAIVSATLIVVHSTAAHSQSNPDGSMLIAGSGGNLVTSAGTWTFSSVQGAGGYDILVNGTSAGGGSADALYLENGGQVYALNSLNTWYLWGGSIWSWSASPLSPDGSAINAGSGGSLITKYGNWTFSSSSGAGGYDILLQGSSAGGGSANSLYVENGGQVYALNSSNNWYLWSSGWWTPVNDPLGSNTGSSGSGSSSSSDPTVGLLPSANDASANWQMAGMLSVGGIPTRTTVCATVNPQGGGKDDSTNINNAISSCPTGEVVSLAAGTFTIAEGNYIWINSSVTVRGAGAGNTILTRTGGGTMGSPNPGSNPSPMVVLSPICWNDCNESYSETTTLSADGEQGSYSVTVASATGFSAGQFVLIDEDMGGSWQQDPQGFSQKVWAAGTYPNYELVWPDHDPQMPCDESSGELPTQSGGDGAWFSNLDRFTNEIKKIVSVSGDTVTFDSPLTSNYRVSHTAQLYAFSTPFLQQASVEDLTAENSDYGAIAFSNCAYCWANAVEVTQYLGQGGFGAVSFVDSFRSQLEGSYIHKADWPVEGGNGYNIQICCGSSEILIENNISVLANKVDVVQSAGAGSVFGYNYFDDGFIGDTSGGTPGAWIETGINGSHFLGSHHILFEGNEAFNADDDGTWGSVHYQTFFRNWFTGFRAPFQDYINNNSAVNDYTDTPGNNQPYRALSTMQWAYNNAYIGNVLGTSGDMSEPSQWSYNTDNINSSTPSEVLLGYDSCNGAMDPEVAASAELHGNYDYVQNQVTWDTSISDETLPSSFYLTSEPAFFRAGSGYPWPWVTPTGSPQIATGPGGRSSLPAMARYAAGTPFTQP